MTRAKAIHAKCKDCIYDPACPGTWKQQTQACTFVDCPLWTYRPISRPKRPKTHTETVDKTVNRIAEKSAF